MKKSKKIKATQFEVKSSNRFIVHVKNLKGESVMPSFLIKGVEIPSFVWNGNVYHPGNLFLTIYDPITPSASKQVMSSMDKKEKWNVTVNVLGPVGEIIESWAFNDCVLSEITFGSLDWSADRNTPLEVEVCLKPKTAKLK